MECNWSHKLKVQINCIKCGVKNIVFALDYKRNCIQIQQEIAQKPKFLTHVKHGFCINKDTKGVEGGQVKEQLKFVSPSVDFEQLQSSYCHLIENLIASQFRFQNQKGLVQDKYAYNYS